MSRAILLLLTDLQIGGTPTVVRELAIRLNAPPAVRADVACLAPRGPVADQLQSAGIRVFPLNARGSFDPAVFLALGRLIADNGYDTVFSFLLHANAAAAVVRPFFPNVRFLQSIQTTQPAPRWHWLVQSAVHHAAERIVVPSPSVARAAEQWSDIPRHKIAIIPNAIDIQPNDADAASIDAAGASASHRATLGFIGRLDPIKRIPDLLHALQLIDGFVELHIYGDGSERRLIETLIKELGLSQRVFLHGAVPSAEHALQNTDLLVLPSEAEGFGLVVLEAMAAGVPVVATNVPGICDVVEDGRTGLLVPPFAPRELATAIDRLLKDPVLRDRLVAQALQEVKRRFTWDVALPQYRALLKLA